MSYFTKIYRQIKLPEVAIKGNKTRLICLDFLQFDLWWMMEMNIVFELLAC